MHYQTASAFGMISGRLAADKDPKVTTLLCQDMRYRFRRMFESPPEKLAEAGPSACSGDEDAYWVDNNTFERLRPDDRRAEPRQRLLRVDIHVDCDRLGDAEYVEERMKRSDELVTELLG